MKKVLGVFIAVCILFSMSACKDNPAVSETTTSSSQLPHQVADHAEPTIEWPEITENGVDESLLIENTDNETLTYVAAEIQTLVQEETEAERDNPELVLTEGWTRVFKSEHYANVIALGKNAMKPLYLILYESPSAGQYEYICAYALYELSGYDFTTSDGTLTWANSTEFLLLFNKAVLSE